MTSMHLSENDPSGVHSYQKALVVAALPNNHEPEERSAVFRLSALRGRSCLRLLVACAIVLGLAAVRVACINSLEATKTVASEEDLAPASSAFRFAALWGKSNRAKSQTKEKTRKKSGKKTRKKTKHTVKAEKKSKKAKKKTKKLEKSNSTTKKDETEDTDAEPANAYAFLWQIFGMASELDGEVYLSWTEGAAKAADIWNKAVADPFVVIEVASEEDVKLALPLLAELETKYHFPFRIRSGGHNYAGYSSVPNGAVLSLARMNSTALSHQNSKTGTAIATLGPAATVQDILDTLLVTKGYGGVLGLRGGVGEAGFALNGGVGYLSRLYGLGLDSIQSLRVVLANGKVVVASPTKNPDLFFALRGAGGGNFGVVTEIKYLMHKSQDTQLYGRATMAFEDLGAFFQTLGEHDDDIPGEVFVYFEEAEEPTVFVSWVGPDDTSLETGREFLEKDLPVMMLPVNISVQVERVSWANSTRAAGNLEGNLVQAWTGFLYADNNTIAVWDDIMSTILTGIKASKYLIPDIELWGGQIGAIDSGATAFPYRDALFNIGVLLLVPNTTVANASMVFQKEVEKVNEWWPSISEYMDGVYLNYQMKSLTSTEYPHQYWGNNLERLVKIKKKYDPDNVFKFPQSVPLAIPASEPNDESTASAASDLKRYPSTATSPTARPNSDPTFAPALPAEPAAGPTSGPTADPTRRKPTSVSTALRTSGQTTGNKVSPTRGPTPQPTSHTTSEPNAAQTSEPTAISTALPAPTTRPTQKPTADRTDISAAPSSGPTAIPTAVPVIRPTPDHTLAPQ